MFQIHPAELTRRHQRCRPVVESLLRLRREMAPSCNICRGTQTVILSNVDRYGFPIRTAMCRRCGLIYVLDRFTREGYSEFYNTGGYRALITRFKGYEQTIQRIQAAQVSYSSSLIRAVSGYIPRAEGARLLDVGGSTGWVAHEFAKQFGFRATLLDPAPEEVRASQALGIEAAVGTIESWETTERFDLILLCRTIEHLFDLRAALTKIRSLLKPNGLFYCDIAEFVEICRREGPPMATTKVDHCFWLPQEIAPNLFRSFGFEVISVNLTLPPDQMGFLLRAANGASDAPRVSGEWIERQVRRFREIETDWYEYGSTPVNFIDWLKRKGYGFKKRLLD